jgi:hypothetical protein
MKPEFGIKKVIGKDVVINTDKAKFQGRDFKTLGGFGRRKFENLLIINLHQEVGGVPRIIYE